MFGPFFSGAWQMWVQRMAEHTSIVNEIKRENEESLRESKEKWEVMKQRVAVMNQARIKAADDAYQVRDASIWKGPFFCLSFLFVSLSLFLSFCLFSFSVFIYLCLYTTHSLTLTHSLTHLLTYSLSVHLSVIQSISCCP